VNVERGAESTNLDRGSGRGRGFGLLKVGDCGWVGGGCWIGPVSMDQKEELGAERGVQ
jgi:hypothetical protein